jgi:hypothetical protein
MTPSKAPEASTSTFKHAPSYIQNLHYQTLVLHSAEGGLLDFIIMGDSLCARWL